MRIPARNGDWKCEGSVAVTQFHLNVRRKAINAPDTLHVKGIAIGRRMLSEGAHYGDALHHAAYYIDVNWSGHKRPNTVIISTKL